MNIETAEWWETGGYVEKVHSKHKNTSSIRSNYLIDMFYNFSSVIKPEFCKMYGDKYHVLLERLFLLKTNAMTCRYNCKIKNYENNLVVLSLQWRD